MGWEKWPPFQYQKDNSLTGLDIELIQTIFENMGYKITFKERPWKRLLAEAENGDTDLVAGASKTSERKKWAYFSTPYRIEKRVLFVLKQPKKPITLKSIKAINVADFKLGVVRGAYNGDHLNTLIKTPIFRENLDEVTTNIQNYKKLIAGRIDGFIADDVSAIHEMRTNGYWDKIEIYPIDIHSSDIHLMFSKKSTSPEQVELFNKSLLNLFIFKFKLKFSFCFLAHP